MCKDANLATIHDEFSFVKLHYAVKRSLKMQLKFSLKFSNKTKI